MNATVVEEMIRLHAFSLKLPTLAKSYEALGRQARESNWTHEHYLAESLSAEINGRSESVIRRRIHEAHFPAEKSLSTFDLAKSTGFDAAAIGHLSACQWVEEAQNVVIAGPIGTGKTHMAIALGLEAARRKIRVAFFRTAELVRILVEARDSRELGKMHRKLSRVDLLILDELGFIPFDRIGGELLFNVMAERYERKSILITSNLAFSEWTQIFAGDEKLTAALLDRLTHHSVIMTTSGSSFRLQSKKKQKG